MTTLNQEGGKPHAVQQGKVSGDVGEGEKGKVYSGDQLKK